MFARKQNGEVDCKSMSNELYDWAFDESERGGQKIGVLLCEGDESSVDYAIYSLIFPSLMVIPVGGCVNVMKCIEPLRKRLTPIKMYVFGIIDRDALSKREIKELYKKKGVNTTKLPFIENIICSPEVIKCVCKSRDIDFDSFLHELQVEVMKYLWRRIKDRVPINLSIGKEELIEALYIQAKTSNRTVCKEVGPTNVLYAFRDKAIASIIGSKLGLKGKKGYYSVILDLIQKEEYKDELRHAFSKYIPKLEFYTDFDEE